MTFLRSWKLKELCNILGFKLSKNNILISNTKFACSPFNFNVLWNINRIKFVQFLKYYSLLRWMFSKKIFLFQQAFIVPSISKLGIKSSDKNLLSLRCCSFRWLKIRSDPNFLKVYLPLQFSKWVIC